MNSLRLAELAVFLYLKAVRIGLLVLTARIISLLTIGASQNDIYPHFFTPPETANRHTSRNYIHNIVDSTTWTRLCQEVKLEIIL